MKKRVILLSSAAAVVLLVTSVFVLLHMRPRRHRLFRPTEEAKAHAPKAIPPVSEWTRTFETLAPGDLDELLDRIEKEHPDLYASDSLAYLQARARLENNEPRQAAAKLAPYLERGNPFRDLALYHASEIAEALGNPADASRDRQALIFEFPNASYRDEAIDDELEFLGSQNGSAPLVTFVARLAPGGSESRKRDLSSRVAEQLYKTGDRGGATQRSLGLLSAGTIDDAAERAAGVLDHPEIVRTLTPAQLALLGTAMQNHRHFSRAVEILSLALSRTPAPAPPHAVHAPPVSAAKTAKRPLPKSKAGHGSKTAAGPAAKKATTPAPAHPATLSRDDLLFAIGRSYFGDEKFAEARQTYLKGAETTGNPAQKAMFLWHASRAAQLLGDDAAAEQLMTRAIAVPGRSPTALAALTQRMRTRLRQHRNAEAAADFALMRKLAPNDHALVDATLAWAIAMVASNNANSALSAIASVPPKLLDRYDQAELAYWRGRALESRDPHGAFVAYLDVLRSPVSSHFAYFARNRLDAPAMASKLGDELHALDAKSAAAITAKNFLLARQLTTDRVLLSARDRARPLAQLAAVYRELPAYKPILELAPETFPALPSAGADRTSRLLALGLYDEAADELPARWPLRPLRSALTQSLALNRGGASKPSIYAIEVLMKSVPEDYVPDLLPRVVRELLYPRYFSAAIEEDSQKYGADPALVLSIMREESRFDPRAKSVAAARGLLQFIITTARQVGRDIGLVDVDENDLYDPRVIIRLGAKYIATLSSRFAGNHYKVAAAYNAGPQQVALWSRMAPADGDDYFLSSINFGETKDYVRKVMNSYRRYGEIYGNSGPQGGLRAEP